MIAVTKRKKTKSSQYRFLSEHKEQLLIWLGTNRFPAQSTYFERYRRAHRLFREAIRIQGEKAVRDGAADPTSVAVDKSLVTALGPQWHKKGRKTGTIPKGLHGVDIESTWGYSEYHGWVQGYSFEVVVTANPDGTLWPLLASADTASTSEHASFSEKTKQLPKRTKYVLADSGYDSNAHADVIEWDANGRRTGRRFLCPENSRNTPPEKPCERTIRRNREGNFHQRRRQRSAFLETARGQRLYARRGTSVEPFNKWFKSSFELEHHVWHRGLDNNRTQLLAALFIYQLLLRYNRHKHRYNGQVQWILDTL